MKVTKTVVFNLYLTVDEAKALKTAVLKSLFDKQSIHTKQWKELYTVLDEKIND